MGQGKGRFAVPLVAVLLALAGLAMAAPAPVRAATLTVGSGGDTSGGGQCANAANATCTLREAIGAAAAGDTITFAAGVTGVTLTSDQLTLTRNVTIARSGAAVTVARSTAGGTPSFRILTVNGGVTANLSNLTISNGVSANNTTGGGIYNNGGTLALTNVTVSGNTSIIRGGGIDNTGGTVTLTNVAVSGNTSSLDGGGIRNSFGTVTLVDSTVSGNSTTSGVGGGIGTFSATTTLTNVTMSGNSGSAIYISGGTTTLTNATVVSGTVSPSPGPAANSGNRVGTRSIIGDPGNPYVLNVTRSIIANTAGGEQGGGINGTNANNFTSGNPLLAPLGDYGGPTQTRPPLPGSPAIDAGGATCSATDQRGLTRPVNANCDIGAVESRGFVFSSPTGSGQTTTAGAAFPTALGVTVTGNIATGSTREPVDGGVVSFTGPMSGASIAPNPTTATITTAGAISDGVASASVTANGMAGGPYTVTASARGTTGSATYSLTNITVACVVTNAADSGAGSLRARVDTANTGGCTGATITFQMGLAGPITLTSGQLTLTRSITITGPGANTLTVARSTAGGVPKFRIFRVDPGVTASITGLTVTGGDADMGDGGGIRSQGNLALTNVVVGGNRASNNGGGIEHNSGGTLTLTGVTLSGNTASQGGGVNVFAATVNGTNVTVSGNTAAVGGGFAIIGNGGTATLANATVSGNTATDAGGGIYNESTVALTNTTVSGNTAPTGQGGGVLRNGGTLNATRSIVAGNTGGDLVGGINGTNANNLTAGNPLLAPLGTYGGGTRTLALLPGSPAIDAGGAGCAGNDQRGLSRPVNTNCDIGAVESRGFTLTSPVPTTQIGQPGAAFAVAPAVAVAPASGTDPVDGGTVTFAIVPGTGGVSGTFGTATGCTVTLSSTVATCTITGGRATAPTITASNASGSLTVAATTAGGVSTVTFTLSTIAPAAQPTPRATAAAAATPPALQPQPPARPPAVTLPAATPNAAPPRR